MFKFLVSKAQREWEGNRSIVLARFRFIPPFVVLFSQERQERLTLGFPTVVLLQSSFSLCARLVFNASTLLKIKRGDGKYPREWSERIWEIQSAELYRGRTNRKATAVSIAGGLLWIQYDNYSQISWVIVIWLIQLRHQKKILFTIFCFIIYCNSGFFEFNFSLLSMKLQTFLSNFFSSFHEQK